jgi:predicted transcriptional regulator
MTSKKKGVPMPEETQTFVNTPMPADLLAMLDEMAEAKDQSRAAVIRQLIRKEYTRFIRAEALRKVEADVS